MGPFHQASKVSENFDQVKELIRENTDMTKFILYHKIGPIEEALQQLQVQQREMNDTLQEIMAAVKIERKKERVTWM